jgi:hypothetical protein
MQFGEIGSVYPVFMIIVAGGLRNPMLNGNQTQILYSRMFIDLLEDVVMGLLMNRIEIPGTYFQYQNNTQ